MKKLQFSILSFVFGCIFFGCAQDSGDFYIHPDSFGIDIHKKIIVLNVDAIERYPDSLTSITLDKTYQFDLAVGALSNRKMYTVSSEGETYKLYITKAPIVFVSISDSLVKFPKKDGIFKYFDADTTFSSPIGMSLRGNLSLTYPKKSFSVEFYEDALTKEKREIKLKNLRKEDDWILDGVYNEPLLLRAYTAQNLWKDVHVPSYASEEPKAKSGVDAFYVDLFVNNEYRGIYLLSEKVNRSLLKLKKYKNNVVAGELFKAGYYQNGTSFKGVSPFKNALPTWEGFEMKYPYEDYESHFEGLHAAVDFVVNSDTKTFEEGIASRFNIDNLMDYFLFINVLRATDNLGKNYYIARYNQETPYFIVPWDLDGIFGTIQDGKRIPTTDDVLNNHLFDRLWQENPNGYKQKIASRWKTLRQGVFHSDSLSNRITEQYEDLLEKKCYERDALVWAKPHDAEHLQYLQEWLEKRLIYLDSYFIE